MTKKLSKLAISVPYNGTLEVVVLEVEKDRDTGALARAFVAWYLGTFCKILPSKRD